MSPCVVIVVSADHCAWLKWTKGPRARGHAVTASAERRFAVHAAAPRVSGWHGRCAAQRCDLEKRGRPVPSGTQGGSAEPPARRGMVGPALAKNWPSAASRWAPGGGAVRGGSAEPPAVQLT